MTVVEPTTFMSLPVTIQGATVLYSGVSVPSHPNMVASKVPLVNGALVTPATTFVFTPAVT